MLYLPEKQCIIVELRAIEGMKWEDVSYAYEEKTGHSLSEKSCRNNFYAAMAAIQPFFTRVEESPKEGTSQVENTPDMCYNSAESV